MCVRIIVRKSGFPVTGTFRLGEDIWIWGTLRDDAQRGSGSGAKSHTNTRMLEIVIMPAIDTDAASTQVIDPASSHMRG